MTDRNLLIGSVIAALVIAAYAALSPNGLPEFLRRRETANELKTQVNALHQQTGELTTQVRALQDTGPRGKALLEKKAREELSMAAPGEIILTIPTSSAAAVVTPSVATPSQAGPAPAP